MGSEQNHSDPSALQQCCITSQRLEAGARDSHFMPD
jgi:hypothetical protein